jgi:hypothetical protein
LPLPVHIIAGYVILNPILTYINILDIFVATAYKLDGESMEKSNTNQTKNRMIHIRLPEDLHKRLRIRAAETDRTIQDWVVEALQEELKRQEKDRAL